VQLLSCDPLQHTATQQALTFSRHSRQGVVRTDVIMQTTALPAAVVGPCSVCVLASTGAAMALRRQQHLMHALTLHVRVVVVAHSRPDVGWCGDQRVAIVAQGLQGSCHAVLCILGCHLHLGLCGRASLREAVLQGLQDSRTDNVKLRHIIQIC
jgi:hypothetical protein